MKKLPETMIWCIGLLALSTIHVNAEEKSSSVMTAAETQNLADSVLRETSVVRGLKIKNSVPCGVQSRSAIQNMVKDSLKQSVSSNEMKAANIYLKQLNLAPANFNLSDYYLKMMDEQLAGYYDPETKKFYTTSRVDRLQLQTVMAHELTHALQDQHFDLSRLSKWAKHDSDARLAMQALVEGDATLAMAQYTAKNPFRSLALIASTLFAGSSSKTFQAAPKVLQQSLTFPYIQGLSFATFLYRVGNWDMVNRAFKDLPTSSEQILHPEKYLLKEEPVNIPFRDVTSQLGAGWKLLEQDVNGEFGLYLNLQEFLDNEEASIATEGWAGDRYAIYQGPKGGNLITQVAVWDSVEDAEEFAQSYIRLASLRTKKKSVSKSGALLWRNENSIIWLQRKLKKVIAIEAAGLNRDPASLAKSLR